MKALSLSVALAGATVIPTPAEAQIFWEAPLMVAPNSPSGLSLVLAEMEPHNGLAGMVAWRGRAAPGGMGIRGGLGEGVGGEAAGFAGVDFSGWILRSDEENPIEIAWVTGVGFGVGNFALISAPLGASLAYPVTTPDLWLNPYVTPYMVLDAALGDDANRDGLDLGLAIDLGVDLAFSADWAIRFAGTLGDRSALAIGLHLPGVAF